MIRKLLFTTCGNSKFDFIGSQLAKNSRPERMDFLSFIRRIYYHLRTIRIFACFRLSVASPGKAHPKLRLWDL